MLPTSERARQALVAAEEEARTLHHSYVGTEHLLLALVRQDVGPLGSAGLTHSNVRGAIVGMMGVGVEAPQGELPLTGAAHLAVERAGREASVLGADEVGPEHILLALLRDQDGAATRIIRQLDVDPAAIRSALS
ncbi:MAG TPA: Clp protease N-terminal domain-containing protein [Solirubrobacteraceae bacterium]|nr:Clp protease N-terminal domain-containing protein [Solirubrobacteraceae bacterium]